MNIEAILSRHPARPDALLPVLHDIQDEFGYIPAAALPLIARALGISHAEVHGVVSYYRDFRTAPPARHVARVCCGEACQANGAEALAAHARGREREDELAVEPVYCLGLCASGPAVQMDETQLHARVTPESFDRLIAGLDAQS